MTYHNELVGPVDMTTVLVGLTMLLSACGLVALVLSFAVNWLLDRRIRTIQLELNKAWMNHYSESLSSPSYVQCGSPASRPTSCSEVSSTGLKYSID